MSDAEVIAEIETVLREALAVGATGVAELVLVDDVVS